MKKKICEQPFKSVRYLEGFCNSLIACITLMGLENEQMNKDKFKNTINDLILTNLLKQDF